MKRLGVVPFVLCLLAFSGVASADLNEGLVAYYPFNGNADDESGYGNHPTDVIATLTEDRFGNPDSAYGFDGTGDYILVPNSASIDVNTFTVSFWVKFDDLQRTQVMLDKRNGQWHRNYGIYFYFDNSQPTGSPADYLAVSIGDKTFHPTDFDYAAFSPVTLSVEEFYFLTATYDQSVLKIYLNAQLIGTKVITMPGITGDGDLYIGSHGTMSSPFSGVLDEVRIYNRALSGAEIVELYEGPQICDADYNGDGVVNGRDTVKKRRDLMRWAWEDYWDWFKNCWLPAKKGRRK